MLQNKDRDIPYRYRNNFFLAKDNLRLPKKQAKAIDLFCFGMLFYTISYILSRLDIGLSPSTCQGLQILALIIIISGAVDLVRFKFDNKYLESVFTIYLVFSFFVIVRIQKFDYNTIKVIFLDPSFGLFIYLVPLVLLFPKNIQIYKRLMNVAFILGLLSLVYIFYDYNLLNDSNWTNYNALGAAELLFSSFTLPAGYILLTYLYHPKKKRVVIFLIMLITLYFLIYRARRGSMFMCITTLAGAGMVYLIYTKRMVLIIVFSSIFSFTSTIIVSNIKLPSMFDFLMSRKDDDTRSGVEIAMKADMTTTDWIIGKGINGTYYYPFVVDDINDLSGQRKVIETGYLQMILKGGLISIVSLGLILIPAVYFALFKSSNILAKGSGIFILLWMIYLYPTVVTGFNIYYILLWMSVGICYSTKIRNMTDGTIKACLYRSINH